MSLSSLKRKCRFFIIKLFEMEVIRGRRLTSGEGNFASEELEMQPTHSI